MILRGWILLAVVAVSSTGFSLIQLVESSLPEPPRQEQPANQDSSSSTGASEADQTPVHNRPGNKKNGEGYLGRYLKIIEKYDKAIVAISTIILALGTFILAMTTGFLWLATRALVKGAESTSERQLRAYIFFPGVQIQNFGTGKPLEAILSIKNSGQTPAYGMRDWEEMEIARFPHCDLLQPTWTPSTASIGPGEGGLTLSTTMRRAPTGEEVTKIISGEFAIYVTCEVRYWDAFGKIERFSRYRGFYRGNGMTPDRGALLPTTQSAEGNDSN